MIRFGAALGGAHSGLKHPPVLGTEVEQPHGNVWPVLVDGIGRQIGADEVTAGRVYEHIENVGPNTHGRRPSLTRLGRNLGRRIRGRKRR